MRLKGVVYAREARLLLQGDYIPFAHREHLLKRVCAFLLLPAVFSRLRGVEDVGCFAIVVKCYVALQGASSNIKSCQLHILNLKVGKQGGQILHCIIRETVANGENTQRVVASLLRKTGADDNYKKA